jgi:hypothetical protein
MRYEQTAVYTAKELRDKYSEAFDKACQRNADGISEYESEDIAGSLRGLIDALSGVTVKDWGFSSYGRDNRFRVEFDNDGAEDLSGARAFSWFENNLFSRLRVRPGTYVYESKPGRYKPETPARHFTDYGKDAKPGRRFWSFNKVGAVPECPFTGACYDEDLLDYIRKGIRSGDSVGEILEGLADECGRILEDAEEYAAKPERFIEDAEANGWEFYEDGSIA